MRKIAVFTNAGLVGTDNWDFWEVPDDVTSEELDDFAWQEALKWAESYGVYPMLDAENDEDYDEDNGDTYTDDITGYWEEYDPEKHDGHSIGGEIHWNQW